jgi:S-adenosylmethionine:tRNA ribosyltransferase-isomerase
MRVADFDFELPERLIALRPAEPRDAARQLVVQPGAVPELADHHVHELPRWLRPGDALVLNDTRVIPARLFGERRRGESVVRIEVLLHRRVAGDAWRAFARPGKRLALGEEITLSPDGALRATVTDKAEGGDIGLAFALSGAALDAAIAAHGEMPLPPYIGQQRPADARDLADYQTTYAARDGAVAAPTAGLHLTPDLLARVQAAGVTLHHVTLHVGAGTFLPVKAETTAEHVMHAEWGEVSEATAAALNAARAGGGRIIAVGTTSLRLLESAVAPDGLKPFSGETDIFITPGHRFRAVDALMTNFHLPRSTLFMLVSAFAGVARMRRAYAHAIASGYRFYSYGDSSLLFRDESLP